MRENVATRTLLGGLEGVNFGCPRLYEIDISLGYTRRLNVESGSTRRCAAQKKIPETADAASGHERGNWG